MKRVKIFKRIIKLFFLTCCICTLYGCGKSDNTVVLQYASWGSKSEVDILEPILTDFEKLHPDIKIEFMHIPQNYFQKIHLLFASNTAPDVIFMNIKDCISHYSKILDSINNDYKISFLEVNSI